MAPPCGCRPSRRARAARPPLLLDPRAQAGASWFAASLDVAISDAGPDHLDANGRAAGAQRERLLAMHGVGVQPTYVQK